MATSLVPYFSLPSRISLSNSRPKFISKTTFLIPKSPLSPKNISFFTRFTCLSINNVSTISVDRKIYEFSDGATEVELRLPLKGRDIRSSRDVFVDISESSLTIKTQSSGLVEPLLETTQLYEKIKPSETIWYIDEDQLVLNIKKHDTDVKWPDIAETWESLTVGVMQLLKATSIYIVGDSTEINQKVARELAVGLGYTPLNTSELLETFGQKTIHSWVISEGIDSVAEAEGAILESLSSHVRTVVATLGGAHGAAGRADKWRHLHAGFTLWISQSEAIDEASAKDEARRNILDGRQGYTKADAVVKLSGWDSEYAQTVAQSCLSALKQLILSDKKLPEKKSLYIRLGCRGDWPNIKPPGWDPSS